MLRNQRAQGVSGIPEEPAPHHRHETVAVVLAIEIVVSPVVPPAQVEVVEMRGVRPILVFFDGIANPFPAIENVDMWKISELRCLWQRQDHRGWWRNRTNTVRCSSNGGSPLRSGCEGTNACRLGIRMAASIKHARQSLIGNNADRPGCLDG